MASGRELKDMYNAMKRICLETSELLVLVRDIMGENGFVPTNGARIIWDTSASFARPKQWLPYFQQMLFIPRAGGSRAVGINILWDDEDLGDHIPFLSAGVCYFESGSTPSQSNEFYWAGWQEESTPHGAALYETVYDSPTKKVLNYLLPLDVLSDESRVQELVIEPLMLLFHERFDEADKAVTLYALHRKDIGAQAD